MARDGSGNYSIPNTFTPSSVIASAAVNANFSDIATALTGSLARDSQGPMTAALLLHTNGAVFEVDPDTGIKRVGANEVAIMAGGGNVLVVSTTTVSISAAINITGALKAGGIGTFADTITVTGAAAGFVPFEGVCTDAGAASGPNMNTWRNSASPAAGDTLGVYNFNGNDSGGNKTLYGYITCKIVDPTNGSEDGDLYFNAIINGIDTTVARSNGTQWLIGGTLSVVGAAAVGSLTVNSIAVTGKSTTFQYLSGIGAGQTYTTPAGCKFIRAHIKGSGGGGSKSQGGIVTGTTGGDTTFNGVSAKGGGGALAQTGGIGGTGGAGSATQRFAGSNGGRGGNNGGGFDFGGPGAPGLWGNGAGGGGDNAGGAPTTGAAATGAGGGGDDGGNGGGGGEHAILEIASPAGTYTFTITAGGAGGGTGAAGGSGVIVVEEYY